MRILLLQSSAYIPSLGGANKANRLLLEQLAAQGHDCRVIGTAGGDGATAFRHAGVEVEAVLDGAHLRAYAAARLRELAPDRVLVSSEDPAQILLEEAVQASPHVVYLAHTTLHLPFGPDGFLQSPARTALLSRAAGIVAVSGYIQDYIRRWAGLDSTLLRFPVYGDGPFPELGDADRGFVTLINPCAVKGISIFLGLARRLPEVAFAAVPTWGTTAEDREALAALPNVRLLPPAANVDEIFRETRVLLAPSLWGEAFGQVAVEAMLRGIPVLASDVGGLPEAKLGVDYVLPVRPIRRYEERFDERKIPVAVVPEQDLGPWEEALGRVLGDRGLYARLSGESRRAAHEFVSGLGTGPFEEYLKSLPTRAAAGPRMKILLVQPLTYLFSHGGAHKANRLLLEGLAARGHSCRVVAPRSELGRETREEFLSRLAGQGIPVASDPEGAIVFTWRGVEVHATMGGRELCAEAVRQIREFEPDWTIVSEDPSGAVLDEVLKSCPTRGVYLAHSPATLPFGPAAFEASRSKTALLARTAGILTVSRAMQDYIGRWAGLDSTVVYSPAYGSGPFPALAGFDRGWVTMVNPSAIKGVSIFAGLARRMPDVPFAAVPTWSTTAADREKLAALPNMTLLPAVDDVDELFARIRVLVVPSLWGEAFGQIVVEALLRGIPVVTSDQGGLPEAGLGVSRIVPVRPIERYETQVDERGVQIPVVPEQDLAPWEAALSALLSDRAEYERISEASRSAAARFVSGLGIEPYERFLAGLAPAATAPAPKTSVPTDMQQKLAAMSPEKLALLARRLKKKEGGGAPQASGIPRLPRRKTAGEDRFPLSFAQQRLWFLDRFEPGSSSYNGEFPIHLAGRLDARLLEAALDEIRRRHEVLRTTYAEEAGEPVQIVHPPGESLSLPVVDLAALPEAARRSESARLGTVQSRRPFDLENGPVLRALLLRLDAEEHLLLIAAHHIAVDNWSANVLYNELSALYAALAAGTPPTLPELPVQYADFAVWQRGWLAGAVLEEQIDFWRRELAGAPALMDLPGDRPRPARQSFRGGRRIARFPPRLAAALRALARQRDATPYMLLLTVFQTLLHRVTGQDDLVVGTPVAGRVRQEVEPLIGFFVNTLPMRARLSHGASFEELLEQARRTALSAFAHQDLPFERLVEALAPERSLSHAPLFQVLFNFLNVPFRKEDPSGGVRLRVAASETGTTRFDLELYMDEHERGLSATLVYSTDLFDATTAARLLGQIGNLLEAVAAGSGQGIGELPLLSAAERHQLLHEWNDALSGGFPEAPEGTGVHELFAAQARRTPEAPAAAFHGAELTYRELADRAGRLARHLRTLGCGPETRVGVALERGLDVPAALLAVLESGAAYVPLDPDYPRERLAWVLADAAPRVLITQKRLLSALPPAAGRVLCLDEELTPGGPDTPVPFHDLQLAYVLYTSGSTGRPKGVEVPHRALVNFLGSMRRAPGFAPGERLLAVTSLAFDIAALEIFLPLTTGGCVELASREEAADGALLAARLRASGAGVMQATPATWRMLLDSGWTGDPGLKALSGGEALPRDLAAALAGRTRELWNLYGPTETTVWSTAARVFPGETGPVSIGPPIAETRIHLLDRDLRTVPLGVPGELYIGGVGLARGYLGRPELTAERFVPDPLAAEMGAPGARLYRTGDLCRHLPGGRMEVLGRVDHQVKVRGFRIELGEIEATLARHPAIREAVVTLRDGALVAYLVLAGETSPPSAELRDLLRASLPEPMVPAVFVELAALPLTPNRKVDRRALPAPGPAATDTARFVAPRTPTEEVLAGLWAEVLGRERVGVTDSFFDLGGHSLLATRVVSRLRSVFGVELPLRALFERPTVAEMALLVEEARRGGRSPAAPPLVPEPREGDLPLSFAQERLWFLDQLEPGNAVYNLTAALALSGLLDAALLEASLSRLVSRHEALRTTFAAGTDGPRQVIAPAAPLPLPRVDLAGLPEAARERELRRLADAHAGRPFDLQSGPLLRTALLRLEDREHVLLVSLHHIVGDGWSLGVLTREVEALYRASTSGEPPDVPDLPIQYADFAVWQRRWLAGETLARQLEYWKTKLAGAPAVLALPTDRPRPPVQDLRGSWLGASVPAEVLEPLAALSRRRGVTLFMTLLAAFQTLLYRHGAGRDLPVGTPIAGRNRAETERLIGLFVNTLVLRGELVGDPGFHGLLDRVRETALDAYAHQDLPFEKLVEALAPERSLAYTPLFQAMLVLQTAPGERPRLPGLSLSPLATESGTARLDFTLSLEEREGGLAGGAEYRTSLFDAPTVHHLLARFRSLLEAVAADSGLRLSEIPLLSPAEQAQLRAWGENPLDVPRGLCLHQLFERQVDRDPEAPALEWVGAGDGERLTYGELDRRANRLAHHLIARGVGPEVWVGLSLERSLAMIVGLLAVAKAGGAYVPLDPTYPAERLAYMVGETRPRVVITEAGLREEAAAIAARPASRPAVAVDPQNAAYVIFTSGSAGRPKGVVVPHAGLPNLAGGLASVFGVGPGDRMLLFAPLAFDTSVFEILTALPGGATLCIAGQDDLLPGPGLLRLLEEKRITRVTLTPSALAALPEGELPAVTSVTVAGEACTTDLVERWGRGRRFFNCYGPTEHSVWVSVASCTPSARRPTIGRPVANKRLAVLDPDANPVPAGVAGELWVGGIGAARGYLNRPDLTAERFRPDPFSPEPGARSYRTGDLVRWLPDGDLDFLGRNDFQVKIRGFRIELEEIEAVLAAHPAVRDAVVLALGEGGDRRLVGYVVPEPGAAPSPSELRAHLSERLPDYMVPAAWATLDALPLTPSDKVDRQALARRAPERREAGAAGRSLRNPIEEVLAGIWAEVLGLAHVEGSESFFELGGHSLLATRVVSRLCGVFGVELPLRALFEEPTLSGLARRIERAIASGVAPQRPPIERAPRGGLIPLSFTQQRLWYLDRLTPGSAAFNLAIAVRLTGALDPRALEGALGEIERRHEILRTTFPTREDLPVQAVAPGTALRLPWVDLSGLPPARREAHCILRAREEARIPFDLARGPVWRTTLVRLDAGDHALFLTLHHIAGDAWSLGILVRELGALYAAFSQGLPSPLPELPVQYADFAAWQRRWLEGDGLSPELAYWRERLAGAPALVLPADLPHRPEQPIEPASLPMVVDPELTRGLASLARTASATLFMTVLAAFQAVLALHTGRYDLVAGSNVANRNRLETEGLIGCFLNVLVLRLDLSGDPTFEELLDRAREATLGASAHQDLPFDRLVQELEPSRTAGRTPLFQVKVDLLPAPPPAALSDLRLSLLDTGRIVARYDLHLALQEENGALSGELTYDAGRFAAATVGRLAARFGRLLAEAARTPGARLSELAERLDAAEAAEQREKRQELGRANLASLRQIRRRPLPEPTANLSVEIET